MKLVKKLLNLYKSFPVGSRASRLVMPGGEWASQMTVFSGRQCLESYVGSGLIGFLSRMFLESSIWHSTLCYLTWRVKVTPQGRSIFQLAASVPSIGDTASGLLPTPTACEEHYRLTGNTQSSGNLGALARKGLIPTPVAADAVGTTAWKTTLRYYVRQNPTPLFRLR